LDFRQDTPLPPGCRFRFNLSHDGSMVVCCFSEEDLGPSTTQKTTEEISVSREDGQDDNDDGMKDSQHSSHEIGVDVMEYKLPRSEKSVEEFWSLMEEHLSPRERGLIEERRSCSSPRHPKEAAVLDGLLQLWTFKEAIIKALGCGLRMELGSISLSGLVSHPEIHLSPTESTATTSTGNVLAVLPHRSSQLAVSFDGNKEDPHWRFWSAVFPAPAHHPSALSPSKYILAVAVKFLHPPSLYSLTPLIHPVTFMTVPELLQP